MARLLASSFGAAVLPQLSWAEAGNPGYLAAARHQDGSYSLSGLSAQGATLFTIALPARGHAGAAHPTRAEAVAFARRPGTYGMVIDCARGILRQELAVPAGNVFNGHGLYLQNGAVLATSEQLGTTSQGIIGLWDVADGYRRIGEFSSGGIGPHEIRAMPDGQILVANGGIATGGTEGREKLNLGTMRSNLTLLSKAGEISARYELPDALRLNSIRHLALRDDGLVGFAMQWQGDPGAQPLLGFLRPGAAALELARASGAHWRAMAGYAGSVAFAGGGDELAITSPIGGRMQRFGTDGAFIGVVERARICGLASLPGGYIMSDGQGGLLALQGGVPVALSLSEHRWDNHIIRL